MRASHIVQTLAGGTIVRIDLATEATAQRMADHIQACGLSATVQLNKGAGAWGVERGLTLTFATDNPDRVLLFALDLINDLNESACLVTVGTHPALLWGSGVFTELDSAEPTVPECFTAAWTETGGNERTWSFPIFPPTRSEA